MVKLELHEAAEARALADRRAVAEAERRVNDKLKKLRELQA
jgi:hypothetical protein